MRPTARITGILLSLLTALLCLCGCRAKTLTGITSFSYSYTGGTYAYAGCSYTASLQDGKTVVTVRLDGMAEASTLETGSEFMEKLTEIANKYGVSSWDGFHKSDSNVLDGSSFSFSLRTDSDQSVSAYGYMKYPKNYRDATDEFEALFTDLYESFYPNKQKLLQKYLDDVLIPQYGTAMDGDNAKFSYPYLAALGPNGENTYFTRGVPEMAEGIVGYIITDPFNIYYETGPDVDYYLLVYLLDRTDDVWQFSFSYYTVDDAFEVVDLGGAVLDVDLFSNDDIFSEAKRIERGKEWLLAYSGCQYSIGGDGSKACFTSIYRLTPDGCELLGDEMVTGAYDKEGWTVQMIEPLLTLAEESGLTKESQTWRDNPYDAVLDFSGRDVQFSTSRNQSAGFTDAIAATKTGEPVEGYEVDGSIYAVHYGYDY